MRHRAKTTFPFSTWAMIRQLGRDGIAAMVDSNCDIAAHMGETLGAHPDIELVCPIELNQFMLRFGDGDEADRLTMATVRQVQLDGIAFIGSATWRGRSVMRVSVSSCATTMADADLTIAAVIAAWNAVHAQTAQ